MIFLKFNVRTNIVDYNKRDNKEMGSEINVNKKHFYMFNVEFVNKSRLPISVNEITIIENENKYKIIKSPRLLAEKDTKRNKEIIRHQEVHSAKFPINIIGLSFNQEFLVMYGPEKI